MFCRRKKHIRHDENPGKLILVLDNSIVHHWLNIHPLYSILANCLLKLTGRKLSKENVNILSRFVAVTNLSRETQSSSYNLANLKHTPPSLHHKQTDPKFNMLH